MIMTMGTGLATGSKLSGFCDANEGLFRMLLIASGSLEKQPHRKFPRKLNDQSMPRYSYVDTVEIRE